MRRLGVTGVADLQNIAPRVNIGRDTSSVNINIRGVMFKRPPAHEIPDSPRSGGVANPMRCCTTRTRAANIPASSSSD